MCRKSIIKFSSFILAFVMLFGLVPAAYADSTAKEYFYKWIKVKSLDELNERLVSVSSPSALKAKKPASVYDILNTDYKSITDALPVMIVYSETDSDGNTSHYYATNNRYLYYLKMNSITGASIVGDFDITAKSFITKTDCDTPKLKLTTAASIGKSFKAATTVYSIYFDDSNLINGRWVGAIAFYGASMKRVGHTYYPYNQNYGYGTFSPTSLKDANSSTTQNNYGFNITFSTATGKAKISSETTQSFSSYYCRWKSKSNVLAASVVNTTIYNSSYEYYWGVFASSNYRYMRNTTFANNASMIEYLSSQRTKDDSNVNYTQSVATEYFSSAYEDDSLYNFTIYIGEPVEAATLNHETAIEGVKILSNGYIGQDETVVVSEGSTLVIEEECYNRGKIRLEGGKLVVKGTLTSYDDDVDSPGAVERGCIEAVNNGTIIVLKGGSIIPTTTGASIKLSNGSYLYNEGLVAASAIEMSNRSRIYKGVNSLLLPGMCLDGTYTLTYNDGVYKYNNIAVTSTGTAIYKSSYSTLKTVSTTNSSIIIQ